MSFVHSFNRGNLITIFFACKAPRNRVVPLTSIVQFDELLLSLAWYSSCGRTSAKGLPKGFPRPE